MPFGFSRRVSKMFNHIEIGSDKNLYYPLLLYSAIVAATSCEKIARGVRVFIYFVLRYPNCDEAV